nr:iron-containing alcohol dehydrogenase [Maliibacterium massiliense]
MGALFVMPHRIFSGENALEQSEPILTRYGKKALIVSDPVMTKLGNVAIIEQALDTMHIAHAVYDAIDAEPTDEMVSRGLEAYRDNGCDFLVAIGGGSALDCMKAIGAMATNPGEICDYMGKIIPNELPPMVAVPTTAGTGSEATQFTIINDTRRNIKMLLKGPSLIPRLAIVDPRFTLTAPPSVTAATGIDALTHAIEAYTSRAAQPLSDTFALSAVKRIFTYLPVAYKDGSDIEARKQMAIAALEAGIAFNNSSVTLVHGLSRPIGSLFHIPHGLANAMLLKDCLSFAKDGAQRRFARLCHEIRAARAKLDDHDSADACVTAVADLCRTLEVPTLAQYGVSRADFMHNMDKMAEDALQSGSPANTRKDVTKEDVLAIYRKLWED